MGTGGKAKTRVFRELFFSEAGERKRPPCGEAWAWKAGLKELPDSLRQGKLPGSLVAAAVLCFFYGRDVICAVLVKDFMARRTKRTSRSRDTYGGSVQMTKVSQSQLSCTPSN